MFWRKLRRTWVVWLKYLRFLAGLVLPRALLEKSTAKAHASVEVWTGSNPFSNSSRVAIREDCRKAAVFFSLFNESAKILDFFHTPKLFMLFLMDSSLFNVRSSMIPLFQPNV